MVKCLKGLLKSGVIWAKYIKHNGSIIFNKYKRPRLIFGLNANVAQIRLIHIFSINF